MVFRPFPLCRLTDVWQVRRSEMAKKFDKKFLLLIFIILCTLAAGFFLTYITSTATEVQSSRLRGIERNGLGSHSLFDSDQEPRSIEPSAPESYDIVLPNSSIPMNASDVTRVQNFSTSNSSIPEFIFSKEQHSIPALQISQSDAVNSSLLNLPYETNVSSAQQSMLITGPPTTQPSMLITGAPTMQPSILVDDLQDFLIPLKEGAQDLLSEVSQVFWLHKAEDLIDSNAQSIESPSRLIADFHSSLKYGEICSDPITKNSKIKLNKKVEIASKNLVDPSGLSPIHQSILREILSRETNLFFEYSRLDLKFRQAVSFSISSHSPNCYSVLFAPSVGPPELQNPSRDKRICGAMRYPNNLNPPSNVMIASPPTFNYLRKNQRIDQYDCVQLVNSFEDIFPALNSETFPFEFEDALGSLLCRCNLTALPSQLPPLSYFTYWESVDLLLEESARSVGNICSFEVNRTEVKKFQRSEYLWIFRKDPERIQQLTPEIMFASYSLHPHSRYHVLTNMIPPFGNQSLPRGLSGELLLPLETSLLSSNFFISNNRYPPNLQRKNHEQNKTKSSMTEESHSPTRKPTSPGDFSHKYSLLPFSSQNMTFHRKLSEIRSFDPRSSSAELNRLELSKKRSQVIPPSRSTFWIASHREVKTDEFDEWLEKDQSRQMNQLRDNDDDAE
jgi:hypothetical protein